MKTRMLLSVCLLAVGMAFTADLNGAETRSDSPGATAKQFLDAFVKLDLDTCVALSHGKMKDDAKEIGKSLAPLKEAAAKGDEDSAFMLKTMQEEGGKQKRTVKSEKINGNTAEVVAVYTADGKTKTEKIFLEKIDGKWKVTDIK